MPFFRKKPVVIEARKFTGRNADELMAWAASMSDDPTLPEVLVKAPDAPDYHVQLMIRTLEGDHTASVGDWIIRGVKGEFYPCKPDIFAATYEPSPSGTPTPATKGSERR